MRDEVLQVPDALDQYLQAELDEGEILRWRGQPSPARVFRRTMRIAAFMSALFLMLGGMCLTVTIMTLREFLGIALPDPPGRIPPLGAIVACGAITLALLGLALWILAMPWREATRARSTVYAVTNTRIFSLVRDARGRSQTDTVEPAHPLVLSRREHANGTGDIYLYPTMQGHAPNSPIARTSLTLWGVRDPRIVERLIRQTFDPK